MRLDDPSTSATLWSRSVQGMQRQTALAILSAISAPLRVELGSVLEDTLEMGAVSYESEAERALVRSCGGVPLGIRAGSVVKRAILDKNVRIGANV